MPKGGGILEREVKNAHRRVATFQGLSSEIQLGLRGGCEIFWGSGPNTYLGHTHKNMRACTHLLEAMLIR